MIKIKLFSFVDKIAYSVKKCLIVENINLIYLLNYIIIIIILKQGSVSYKEYRIKKTFWVAELKNA